MNTDPNLPDDVEEEEFFDDLAMADALYDLCNPPRPTPMITQSNYGLLAIYFILMILTIGIARWISILW